MDFLRSHAVGSEVGSEGLGTKPTHGLKVCQVFTGDMTSKPCLMTPEVISSLFGDFGGAFERSFVLHPSDDNPH